MKKVRDAEWSKLDEEERKNHPWVLAGRKASLQSYKKGSKNQMYAFKLLRQKSANFNWKYNYTIENAWQVDIADPDRSIYIEWDGRHHFIPIYGKSYLNNRINRDKIKDKIITKNLKGCLIRVRDEGKANRTFVETKVNEILSLLGKGIVKGELIKI